MLGGASHWPLRPVPATQQHRCWEEWGVSGGQRVVESTHALLCAKGRPTWEGRRLAAPEQAGHSIHQEAGAVSSSRLAARGGEHLLEEARWNSAGWFLLLALHAWVCRLHPSGVVGCVIPARISIFGLYHHHLLRPLRHQRLAHCCRQLLQTEPPGAAQQLGTACAGCRIPLCGAGGVWGCGGAFCVWFPCLTGRLACTLMGYDGADAGAPAEVQTSVVCRLQGACREHVLDVSRGSRLLSCRAEVWKPTCCLTTICDGLRDLLVKLP